MSDTARPLAPRSPEALGREGFSGLAPSALATDLPPALGTLATAWGRPDRGKPGEAPLLSTARVTSATSTTPTLARALWFTAPSTRPRPCGRSHSGWASATRPPRPRPGPGPPCRRPFVGPGAGPFRPRTFGGG